MAKAIFLDPAAVLDEYTWHVNYLDQKGPGRARQTSYDTNAAGVGIIGTQGAKPPVEIDLTGRILHRNQFIAFHEYFNINNSFRYTDEEGFEYEVTMESFEPVKKRCFYNGADSTMRLHTYDYTMKLRVLTVLSGDLLGLLDI